MTTTLAKGLFPVRTVLDNGIVLLVQETSATPAVAINATFLAGSVYEPQENPGLAYLTGRVLDRGTARRPADVIAEELDERGVAVRVTVARHTMTLSCTCLSEDFDEVLAIVTDISRRPTFPEVEVNKQRAEIVTALRQDQDNTSVRAIESVFELLYGKGHPYGRPSKGTIESVETVDRAALTRFHASSVQPGALTLAVVGDVRSGRVLDRAAAELSDWAGTPAPPVIVPAPPVPAGRRERVIPMPGKVQTDIGYGFTATSRLDPRYYAYWMMNNILGQFGLGGRLAENIRERQGMAYYAFSVFDSSVGEGPLLIRAGVDPLNVERALEAIDAEVGKLGTEGPTPEEVEETRDALIGSIPRMFETNHSIAAFLQTSEHFGLGLDYDQRLPGLLEAVTYDEVRAAAAEVLRPDRAAVAVAGPHEAV
jgi:zinc protease